MVCRALLLAAAPDAAACAATMLPALLLCCVAALRPDRGLLAGAWWCVSRTAPADAGGSAVGRPPRGRQVALSAPDPAAVPTAGLGGDSPPAARAGCRCGRAALLLPQVRDEEDGDEEEAAAALCAPLKRMTRL